MKRTILLTLAVLLFHFARAQNISMEQTAFIKESTQDFISKLEAYAGGNHESMFILRSLMETPEKRGHMFNYDRYKVNKYTFE